MPPSPHTTTTIYTPSTFVTHLEETRLKTGEGTPYAQVQFLSRIDRQRLIAIRVAKGGHGVPNVLLCDG